VALVSADPADDIPDGALLSALEFAIGIAAAGAKLRPQLPFPPGLKKFLRFHKLPATAVTQVRAAIEADEVFRERLGSVATTELVDEVGVWWLARPDGWRQSIAAALTVADSDGRVVDRREERRRQAAQEAAAKARAELLRIGDELQRERAASRVLNAETDRLREELDEMRRRLRQSQRSHHQATQSLAALEAQRAAVVPELTVEDTPPIPTAPTIDVAALRALIDEAATASAAAGKLLVEAAHALLSEPVAVSEPSATRPRRAPLARKPPRLPGGVIAASPEGAEFVLRQGAGLTLVDGYNVAKLGWPALDLEQQRRQCVTAVENLAKRWNLAVTVVFDGANVEGAHTASRRRVRVVYSAAGVSADDVLRAEVAAADPARPVVVVTNDREIVADVRRAGASVVSSDDFLTLMRG
jgi:predicted RNA-binding protein with PIN domain